MEKIGFSVSVKDKNIRNAMIFCDNTVIAWLDDEGKESKTKNLGVGDNPSTFYPFRAVLSHISFLEKEEKIHLDILQKMVEYGQNFTEKFERTIFSSDYLIPLGCFCAKVTPVALYSGSNIYCNIRVVGEGIESELNRYLTVQIRPLLFRKSENQDLKNIYINYDLEIVKETSITTH